MRRDMKSEIRMPATKYYEVEEVEVDVKSTRDLKSIREFKSTRDLKSIRDFPSYSDSKRRKLRDRNRMINEARPKATGLKES